MRDLLRDLFWNGTWPNETAPTIPATPMKSAYYFIYIIYIYIYYICILLYILLWCCSVTQVKLAHPGLKLPSQALEVASTDAVVDMSRAGSLAGNWQPRTSKRFPIAMILPWFCHDVCHDFAMMSYISIHTFSMVFHYTGDHYGQIPHPNLCLLQWPLAFQSSWSWPRCKWELLILWTRGRVQPLCTCQSPAQSSILTTVNADIVVTLMPFLNL